MLKAIKASVFATISAAALAGCVSEQPEIEAVPMSASEIRAVLANHTMPLGAPTWEEATGATYYRADGTASFAFNGMEGEGTWRATNDSQFCVTWAAANLNNSCYSFERNATQGGYLYGQDGRKRAYLEGVIVRGNQMDRI